MASEPAKFPSSDIIELLAEGESRFFVHKDILTSQSAPFETALAGQWKEASELKIDLVDWDGPTVGRLVEFLYWGKYRYPDPASISPETNLAPQKIETVVSPALIARDESQSFMSRPLTPVSECLGKFLLAAPEPENITAAGRLARFDPAKYDYGDTLLAHAKVYHLAHYKAIDKLRTMALQHLLDTLSRMDPVLPSSAAHNVGGIVGLAQYAYANTDRLEKHEEPLRRLVTHFIASNFLILKSTPDMGVLFSAGGDIVMDVMENVFRGPPAAVALETRPETSLTRRESVQYVSEICITSGSRPPGYIQELNNTDSQINWRNGNSPLWLYPVYTKFANNACTSLGIQIGGSGNHEHDGAVSIGNHRRIVWNRDPDVLHKITEVALLRMDTQVTEVSEILWEDDTYNGITSDINRSHSIDFLYIVWRAVPSIGAIGGWRH